MLDAREFYVNQAEQIALKEQMSVGATDSVNGQGNTRTNVCFTSSSTFSSKSGASKKDANTKSRKSSKQARAGKSTKTSQQHATSQKSQRAACSLSLLYDPDNAFPYPRLTRAHAALDSAVEQVYNVQFNGFEELIVAHLFKLYDQLISK